MNDLTQTIQEALGASLNLDAFELLGVVPIPMSGDKMVRLRSLEEALHDFDGPNQENTIGYLVQVKSRSVSAIPVAGAPFRNPSSATQLSASSTPLSTPPSTPLAAPMAPLSPELTSPPPSSPVEQIYQPDGKLNIAFLVRNAELLFSSGEYTLARNIFKALLHSGDRTAAALYGMARCYAAEGKIEEACHHFEQSITYHPTLEAYRNLATLLIQQKKDQQACEVAERALNLKNLTHAVRLDLHKTAGNCCTRLKRAADAERHYQKALELDPSADDIRANLGALCLQSGKLTEARRHFQDAVASNPKNDKAFSGLASCFLASGEKREAHDHFARALEIDLNNANAIFYVVKCAYEIKSYATAARLLEEYLQVAPINVNLIYSLAGLQFHLGRMPDAQASALKIIELAPDHSGARELLGLIERLSSPTG